MNFFRTHRSLIAWMLYAFILFNGLACAIGHGQMMGAFSAQPAALSAALPSNPEHHSHHDMSAMADHEMSMDLSAGSGKQDMAMPGSMQSLFGDCSFAGTLTLAMIFFVVLSWLIRTRNPRFTLPVFWPGLAPRYCLPRLNPQAP